MTGLTLLAASPIVDAVRLCGPVASLACLAAVLVRAPDCFIMIAMVQNEGEIAKRQGMVEILRFSFLPI